MNDTASEHLDLERALAVLRRRWWVIVALTIVVGGATFLLAKAQTKQYTATASVLFEDSQLSQQASGLPLSYNSPSSDPVIMGTDVQLLSHSPGVAAATAAAIGHGLTAAQVASAISVSQQGQTDIADVSATSTNRRLAARIANTYVAQFIAQQAAQARAQVAQALQLVHRQVRALSPQQLAGTNGQALVDRQESLRVLASMQNGGVRSLSSAHVPSSPSSPKVTRDVGLGVLVGLLLGLSLAFLLERFDRRIKNVEDLERAYRLPLLATVPSSKRYTVPPQLEGRARDGHDEVFPLLRAYLRYFNVDRELRTLVVASAAPGDGKSTVARNLAQAARETGSRTLLLEADLRRPDLARLYGLEPAPGVSEVLIGAARVEEAVRRVPVATRVNGTSSQIAGSLGIDVVRSAELRGHRAVGAVRPDSAETGILAGASPASLPASDDPPRSPSRRRNRETQIALDVLVAGNPPPNPAELLESRAMADLLAWAAERYELVVIDTPPLAVVADAMPLLARSDGVVVVSQLGRHSRDSASFLRERLVAVNAPLLGVIANCVKGRGGAGYGYGYGYGYGKGYQTEGAAHENGHSPAPVGSVVDERHQRTPS